MRLDRSLASSVIPVVLLAVLVGCAQGQGSGPASAAPRIGAAPVPSSIATGSTDSSPAPANGAGANPAPGRTLSIDIPPPMLASRVVVKGFGIDLPVVSSDLQPPPGNYPLCDVAQYLTLYKQPGQTGSTYIYAHARDGMFLPLLQAAERNGGAELIGAPVQVYRNDGRVYDYEIFEVERHSTTYHLADDVPGGDQRLILQTSEGPYGTIPKLVIAARYLGDEPGDPVAANPEPHPRDCRPEGTPIPEPTATPDVPLATRVTLPDLSIDLPIVSGDLDPPGNPTGYPLCDVAQYLSKYRQPSQSGTTYIYAHARPGMFLPLLKASLVRDGAGLIGKHAFVYAHDGRVYEFEIYRVERHATDFSLADIVPAGEHRLILQTSEGPNGTVPKLVIAARPVGDRAGSVDEATPSASPRVCG